MTAKVNWWWTVDLARAIWRWTEKNLRLDLNARGSYCQPGVVCVTLMRFAQLKKVLGVGSKIGPLRRHLDSTCWGSTFGHLYKGNVFKKDQKVDPLKSKVVPPGGSSFGPFIVGNLLKRFKLKLDFTSNSCDWNFKLFEALIATRYWFVWRWCVSRSWRRCLVVWAQNRTSKEAPDSTC